MNRTAKLQKDCREIIGQMPETRKNEFFWRFCVVFQYVAASNGQKKIY
jgi:hypothetical protein